MSLGVVLALKLSGHTNTLTEASSLLDELNKKVEMEIDQEHRNALGTFRMK